MDETRVRAIVRDELAGLLTTALAEISEPLTDMLAGIPLLEGLANGLSVFGLPSTDTPEEKP